MLTELDLEKKRIEYAEQSRRDQEEIDRNKFYQNVESVNKSLDFFFWLTVVGLVGSVITIIVVVFKKQFYIFIVYLMN